MAWQSLMKNLEGPVTMKEVLNERIWYNNKLMVNGQYLDNKI